MINQERITLSKVATTTTLGYFNCPDCCKCKSCKDNSWNRILNRESLENSCRECCKCPSENLILICDNYSR